MKSILLFCLLLCIAGSVSALEPFEPNAISVGIGPEVNGFSRAAAAVGGNFFAGLDLDFKYSIGLKTSFYHNLDTVSGVEPQLFFRYYLPYWRPLEFDGPFIQAELGVVILIEYNDAYPAFSGAVSAGWRFPFAEQWFVEPALRFGFPFYWGFNVTAGYSFLFAKGQ